MPRLNEAQRNQAVGMIWAGVSQNEVSRRFGMHRNTISALWTSTCDVVKTLTSVRRIFVTDFKLLRWRLEAFLAWGTLVQEPQETACVNRTFALGVQQSVQSYSDVTVLLALHGAGPIFALLDEIGHVSCSQMSHISTWIAVMVVPGYTVVLENGTRITVLLNVVSLAGAV